MNTRGEIITAIKQTKSEHELYLIHCNHRRTIQIDPYLKAIYQHKRYELTLSSFDKR